MRTIAIPLILVVLSGCSGPTYHSQREVCRACFAERHPEIAERQAEPIRRNSDPECRQVAQAWADQQERLESWKIWNHWYLVPLSAKSREQIRREGFERCLSTAKLPFWCSPYTN